MTFASIRWGLPNLAVVIALAVMPMVSLALPDQSRIPTFVDSGEPDSPVSSTIEIMQMATSGTLPSPCHIMPH